jgi:hypothetical protein
MRSDKASLRTWSRNCPTSDFHPAILISYGFPALAFGQAGCHPIKLLCFVDRTCEVFRIPPSRLVELQLRLNG